MNDWRNGCRMSGNKCIRCKDTITGKHWNSKYCKECARTVHLMQMKHWQRKYRKLGTTNFKEHRSKDFNKEEEEINKEFNKLGLKRVKLYKQ